MPSKTMDHCFRFSSQKQQLGFRKTEHLGAEGNKPVLSSPLQKLHSVGGTLVECLDLTQPYPYTDSKNLESLEHQWTGDKSTTSISATEWTTPNQHIGSRFTTSEFKDGNEVNLNALHHEDRLFSSSLSDMFNKNLSLPSSGVHFGQSVHMSNFHFEHNKPVESLEEIEAKSIGNLLPESVDDLLSGIIHNDDHMARPNFGNGNDIEDDLFYSGGGFELDGDDNLTSIKASQFVGEGASNGQLWELPSQFAGEQPSRTIFVKNISSNVEDTELKDLFEQYGEICTLYTACKHRGFIMISYYDIRAARNAMKSLQNKPLRGQKLDIHFSVPKDNSLEKDVNKGTPLLFNLDSSVSNDDLQQQFGAYGEVKEIRESPQKHHQKLIEFYDVRNAETAFHGLIKSDIVGKKIKFESYHPGGSSLCSLMQRLPTEFDQEESSGCKFGFPDSNSPSKYLGSSTLESETSNCINDVAIQNLHSAVRQPGNPLIEFHGISSSMPHRLSSTMEGSKIGNHGIQSSLGDLSYSLGSMNVGYQYTPTFHPQSLPDYHGHAVNGIPLSCPSTMLAMDIVNSRPADASPNSHAHRVGSGSLNGHIFDRHEGVSGNENCPLHGHQYLWNNSDPYHDHPPGVMLWQNSPSSVNSIPSHHPPQMHGLPRALSHVPNTNLSVHPHHVGSAPVMDPSHWERPPVYTTDSMTASAFLPGSLEFASQNIFRHAGGNCLASSFSSSHVGIPSAHHRCNVFHRRNLMPGPYDAPNDRVRSRRSDTSMNQTDNKRQYELDIDRIMRGEDFRTTLMIKNIPNKYTSKMLLATIDEHHRGTYDFFYLPIDFKNKCNVGYAFINMIDPQHITSFYQTFNGKKWEKFNSEKVVSLAYARIQGRQALVGHFQNSSLMNEDKRCRPILFHTDGLNAGDQEPFPIGVNIRYRPGRSRTFGNEEAITEVHHPLEMERSFPMPQTINQFL